MSGFVVAAMSEGEAYPRSHADLPGLNFVIFATSDTYLLWVVVGGLAPKIAP